MKKLLTISLIALTTMVIGQDNMGGVIANRVTGSWASTLGGTAGTETHTLSSAEMASHAHDVTDNYFATGTGGALTGQTTPATNASTFKASLIATDAAGSGGAHNNMQPSIAVAWIIRAG